MFPEFLGLTSLYKHCRQVSLFIFPVFFYSDWKCEIWRFEWRYIECKWYWSEIIIFLTVSSTVFSLSNSIFCFFRVFPLVAHFSIYWLFCFFCSRLCVFFFTYFFAFFLIFLYIFPHIFLSLFNYSSPFFPRLYILHFFVHFFPWPCCSFFFALFFLQFPKVAVFRCKVFSQFPSFLQYPSPRSTARNPVSISVRWCREAGIPT